MEYSSSNVVQSLESVRDRLKKCHEELDKILTLEFSYAVGSTVRRCGSTATQAGHFGDALRRSGRASLEGIHQLIRDVETAASLTDQAAKVVNRKIGPGAVIFYPEAGR